MKAKAKRLSKVKSSSLDRISSLPPTIIETILCLLPIQEAARTSILSKEWRYKWTKIPELEFNEDTFKVSKHENEQFVMDHLLDMSWERKDMSKRFKLFYAIYQVLLAHRGPIVEFSLSVVRTEDTCVEIDHIIAHLSRTNTLKKLSLEFGHGYRLPFSIFSLHQLTDLYIYMGHINHQPRFNGFANLTSLYLDSVNISKNALLHLLSKCPLLKSASLLLTEDNILNNDNFTILELFECLPFIEELALSGSFIECFAEGVVSRVLPTTLIHLKYFYLDDMCFLDSRQLVFLTLLIRSSPNLENLIISNISELAEVCTQDEIDAVKPQDYSDIRLEHLTKLKITNFSNFKTEKVFLKHILATSPVLKKASIVLDSLVAKNEDLQISRILSHYPHASPVVEVCTQDEIDAVKPQDYSDIRLEHLTKLKITNFSNFKTEKVFLKHILATSPVLKKASIVLDSLVAKNEDLQISRILSHYPHASPVVEISVKQSD